MSEKLQSTSVNSSEENQNHHDVENQEPMAKRRKISESKPEAEDAEMALKSAIMMSRKLGRTRKIRFGIVEVLFFDFEQSWSAKTSDYKAPALGMAYQHHTTITKSLEDTDIDESSIEVDGTLTKKRENYCYTCYYHQEERELLLLSQDVCIESDPEIEILPIGGCQCGMICEPETCECRIAEGSCYDNCNCGQLKLCRTCFVDPIDNCPGEHDAYCGNERITRRGFERIQRKKFDAQKLLVLHAMEKNGIYFFEEAELMKFEPNPNPRGSLVAPSTSADLPTQTQVLEMEFQPIYEAVELEEIGGSSNV